MLAASHWPIFRYNNWVCCQFLQRRWLRRSSNAQFISQDPQYAYLSTLSDFRPICLAQRSRVLHLFLIRGSSHARSSKSTLLAHGACQDDVFPLTFHLALTDSPCFTHPFFGFREYTITTSCNATWSMGVGSLSSANITKNHEIPKVFGHILGLRYVKESFACFQTSNVNTCILFLLKWVRHSYSNRRWYLTTFYMAKKR